MSSWHDVSGYAMNHNEELLEFVNALNYESTFSRFFFEEEEESIWVEWSFMKPFDEKSFMSMLEIWIEEFMALPLYHEHAELFIDAVAERAADGFDGGPGDDVFTESTPAANKSSWKIIKEKHES